MARRIAPTFGNAAETSRAAHFRAAREVCSSYADASEELLEVTPGVAGTDECGLILFR